MKVLVDIGHPAHVHLFKNLIWNLEKDGHEVKITARNKEFTLDLLDAYKFEYENRGEGYNGLFRKAIGLIKINYKLYKISRKFKPDIFVGAVGNLYISQVSKLLNKHSIIFDDTEHAHLEHWLCNPFVNAICTPSCFKKDLGKKQIRYNGYHELAYLHPNYFKPDPSVLDELNLSKDDKFIILRFVAWQASHDVGQKGFDLETKRKLVRELEKYGRVLITSEKPLPKKFEKYRITIAPEKIHDLLYYATMYIGEGATMASECACLGTPAIYINTLRLGYTDEEEKKYGLLYNFSDPKMIQKQALEKAVELLENRNLKSEWRKKRERMLSEKIDVTKWMTEFIENYPESFYEQRSNLYGK